MSTKASRNQVREQQLCNLCLQPSAGCGNKRQRKTPQRFNDYVMGQEMENLAPHSYALLPTGLAESAKEALQDSNGKAAMDREYESLISNKVWTLVKRVKGKQPIAMGW